MEAPNTDSSEDRLAARRIWVDVPCRTCHRSLRDLRLDDNCPDCRTPVAQSLRDRPQRYLTQPAALTSAEVLDSAGRIRLDLPCRGCGYNLRLLAATGRCPECGAPIGASCYGDLLRYCAPVYVRRLARGCRWICVAITAVLVAWLSSFLAAFSRSLMEYLIAVITGVMALAGVLVLAGVWQITSAEPHIFNRSGWLDKRMLVRVGLGAVLLGLAANYVLKRTGPPMPVMAGAQLILALVWLAGAAGAAAYFFHLADLGFGIPDIELIRKARDLGRATALALAVLWVIYTGKTVVFWGPVLWGGSAALPSPTAQVASAGLSPWPLCAVECAGGLAGLVLFCVCLMAIRLHWRFKNALRVVAEMAQTHWDQAQAQITGEKDSAATD